MTVKSLQAIDMLLENKKKVRTGILDPNESWNKHDDMVKDLANFTAERLQVDVEWLQAIKNQLLPEQHRTKIICRHPKKDHDMCGDQKYCMACNANL